MGSRAPTVGVGYSVNNGRTIADRIISIQIGIVIGAAIVVIVTVTTRIVAPT